MENKNTSEPIHIISLGAGVQSSTMALMAAKGEITPTPKCAIFADTQNESQATYTYLDWLEKQLPFPVVRVTRGNLWEHVTTRYINRNGKENCRTVPAFVLTEDGSQGLMRTNCSTEFKKQEVHKEITAQMRIHKAERAVQWIGISVDEITRMKDSTRSTVDNRYPLIELRMTRGDCLSWLDRNELPIPPRSACIFCPLRDNKQWRALSADEFKLACQFEEEYQQAHGYLDGTPFLHRKMIPLSRVDFSTEEERGQLNMFNNECEGMCGV